MSLLLSLHKPEPGYKSSLLPFSRLSLVWNTGRSTYTAAKEASVKVMGDGGIFNVDQAGMYPVFSECQSSETTRQVLSTIFTGMFVDTIQTAVYVIPEITNTGSVPTPLAGVQIPLIFATVTSPQTLPKPADPSDFEVGTRASMSGMDHGHQTTQRVAHKHERNNLPAAIAVCLPCFVCACALCALSSPVQPQITCLFASVNGGDSSSQNACDYATFSFEDDEIVILFSEDAPELCAGCSLVGDPSTENAWFTIVHVDGVQISDEVAAGTASCPSADDVTFPPSSPVVNPTDPVFGDVCSITKATDTPIVMNQDGMPEASEIKVLLKDGIDITKLRVLTNVTHPKVNSLQMRLKSTSVLQPVTTKSSFLIQTQGGNGENLQGTVFDDEAEQPFPKGFGSVEFAPYTGSWQPVNSLDKFVTGNKKQVEYWSIDWLHATLLE